MCLIMITVLFLGCGNSNQSNSNSVKQDSVLQEILEETTESTKKQPEPINNEEVIKEINSQLYSRLINGNHGPFASKNKSGYYVLDLNAYLSYLDGIGIFGQSFIENETMRTKECREDLEQLQYREEPETGWAPSSCSFDYMFWLKSQESPDGYEINDFSVNENQANVKMDFYTNVDGQRAYWNGSLTIDYEFLDNSWFVAKIEHE